jgi:hypothetical protein
MSRFEATANLAVIRASVVDAQIDALAEKISRLLTTADCVTWTIESGGTHRGHGVAVDLLDSWYAEIVSQAPSDQVADYMEAVLADDFQCSLDKWGVQATCIGEGGTVWFTKQSTK